MIGINYLKTFCARTLCGSPTLVHETKSRFAQNNETLSVIFKALHIYKWDSRLELSSAIVVFFFIFILLYVNLCFYIFISGSLFVLKGARIFKLLH